METPHEGPLSGEAPLSHVDLRVYLTDLDLPKLAKVELLHHSTPLSVEQLALLAEYWGQSDHFHEQIPHLVIQAVDPDD